MAGKKSRKYIKRLHSNEPLRTFAYGAGKATVFPTFNHSAALELVDKDPVARGALQHFTDKCLEGDFSIIFRDSKKFDKQFQERLQKDYNFRTAILRPIFMFLKIYNNVFIEIVRKADGSVKSLNILDTANVDVMTKPNGDLIKVTSKVINPETGEYATWPEGDIVWIKLNDRSTGWAPSDLRSLWETLLAKDYIRRYESWIWETGQHRVLYAFKDATSQDIENFLVYARKHDNNFRVPFITKGEVETKVLRDIKEHESIDLIMKYYDMQVAIAMRVPPNDLGMPDASGRSNADAQANNFNTHVRSVKTLVEDYINNHLFPKMNKGNSLLRFAPNDRFVEKQVYEVVQIMKSVGMTDDAVREYMYDRGLVFETEKLFDQPEDRVVSALQNPRDKDTAPSRAGKGTGEGNAELEEVSTRSDQIKQE